MLRLCTELFFFQELLFPIICCIGLMAFSFQPSTKYDPQPLGDLSLEVTSYFDDRAEPLGFAPNTPDTEQIMMDVASVLSITADPQVSVLHCQCRCTKHVSRAPVLTSFKPQRAGAFNFSLGSDVRWRAPKSGFKRSVFGFVLVFFLWKSREGLGNWKFFQHLRAFELKFWPNWKTELKILSNLANWGSKIMLQLGI